MIVAYALGNFHFTPQAPVDMDGFVPTEARPGSPEKMSVLRGRIKDGFPPHHPHDKKADMRPRLWPKDEHEEYRFEPGNEPFEEIPDEAA